MKKYIYIIIALASVMLLSACNEWLEATSSTKIPADKLYETRGGFCDGLSGIYIQMGDSHIYGGGSTFLNVDLTSVPYKYEYSQVNKALQDHQYNHIRVKTYILQIWTYYYNVIANINLTLSEMEKHRAVITTEEEYNLFTGELYGLRAYIHLDLMRLFGIGDISGENAAKKTIPYVLDFDKEPTAQKTYLETCLLIQADIDKALECLKNSDPVAGVISEATYNSINQDGFWTNRKKHLNYYSVLALQARLQQWMGDTEGAAETAQEVIDGAFTSGLVSWVDPEALLTETNWSNKDLTFSCEQLFSLEITSLYEQASVLFSNSVTTTASYVFSDSYIDDILYVRMDPKTGSLAGAEDVRGPSLLLNYTVNGYQSLKLSSYEGPYKNIFPMMRISEMYYMIAENKIAQKNNAAALKTLDEVRRHRGISEELVETADADDELMREYYKEFLNEGQLIFWLKHKNVQQSLNPSFTVKGTDLTFPYPDEEINYGRVQEL